MTSEKENIMPSKKYIQDEIPFEDIKNPKEQKQTQLLLTMVIEEISKKLNIPNGVAKALIFGNLHERPLQNPPLHIHSVYNTKIILCWTYQH